MFVGDLFYYVGCFEEGLWRDRIRMLRVSVYWFDFKGVLLGGKFVIVIILNFELFFRFYC